VSPATPNASRTRRLYGVATVLAILAIVLNLVVLSMNRAAWRESLIRLAGPIGILLICASGMVAPRPRLRPILIGLGALFAIASLLGSLFMTPAPARAEGARIRVMHRRKTSLTIERRTP
jgi:hypothetical protein